MQTRRAIEGSFQTKDRMIAMAEWEKFCHTLQVLGYKKPHLFDHQTFYNCDHKVPVCHSEGDLKYFSLKNLNLLCVPCHAVKTRFDNQETRRYREMTSMGLKTEIVDTYSRAKAYNIQRLSRLGI
jgi:hypothetical protein